MLSLSTYCKLTPSPCNPKKNHKKMPCHPGNRAAIIQDPGSALARCPILYVFSNSLTKIKTVAQYASELKAAKKNALSSWKSRSDYPGSSARSAPLLVKTQGWVVRQK